MKKLLILLLDDSTTTRLPQVSWVEKHMGAVVEHYGYTEPEARMQEAVQKHKPDVVVYSATLGSHQPGIEWLAWLKTQCRSVCIGWDAGSPNWYPWWKRFRDEGTFDLTIAAEGSIDAGCDMATVNPYNPEPWMGEQPTRDIELGFWGGISNDDNPRHRLIKQVRDLVTVMEKGNPQGPYSNYIKFVKRCWATFNIAWQGEPKMGYARHVKGRCIEAALGGSALFEAKGSPLAHWFEPGVDYFEFDEERPRDIIDTLRNPDYHAECTLRAERMLKKVRELYGPEKFWAKVMG